MDSSLLGDDMCVNQNSVFFRPNTQIFRGCCSLLLLPRSVLPFVSLSPVSCGFVYINIKAFIEARLLSNIA